MEQRLRHAVFAGFDERPGKHPDHDVVVEIIVEDLAQDGDALIPFVAVQMRLGALEKVSHGLSLGKIGTGLAFAAGPAKSTARQPNPAGHPCDR